MYEKSVYGYYLNYDVELPFKTEDKLTKLIRKLSYEILGSPYHQSIHHINVYHDEFNKLDNIKISFRKNGIKPENIDINYLLEKQRAETISHYEKLMLEIGKHHYNEYDEEEINSKIQHLNKVIEHAQLRIDKLNKRLDETKNGK